MDFATACGDRAEETVALFKRTFTASEGAEEGQLIGRLVAEMCATTAEEDLVVVSCLEDGGLIGCSVFSRLIYPEDDRTVFVMAPVAVETERQRRGLGQALIRHGLETLRARGVDVAMTYGDPAYYGKVGFAPTPEAQARAPRTLTYPDGWLAQSLTERPLDPLKGPSRCVAALDSPDYW